MNTRALIFPMTVGDLVQSVEIVAIRRSSTGRPELELLEVVGVELGAGLARRIHVRSDRWTDDEPKVLELDATTPILVTGISAR